MCTPPPPWDLAWGTSAGGTPPQVPPSPVRPGQGVPCWGYPARGVPHLKYPPWGLAGEYPAWGYPTSGTPHQTRPRGVPCRGGGTPPQVTDGVLDMPQSVCLLCSRRRTYFSGHQKILTPVLQFPVSGYQNNHPTRYYNCPQNY